MKLAYTLGASAAVLAAFLMLIYTNRVCFSRMEYVSDREYVDYARELLFNGAESDPSGIKVNVIGNVFSSYFGFMASPVNGKQVEVREDGSDPRIFFAVISPCGTVLTSTR